MVERFNKILVIILSVYVFDYQLDWDKNLLYVFMVYWFFQYENMGYILNMLMLGREVVILVDIMYEVLNIVKFINVYDWVWKL